MHLVAFGALVVAVVCIFVVLFMLFSLRAPVSTVHPYPVCFQYTFGTYGSSILAYGQRPRAKRCPSGPLAHLVHFWHLAHLPHALAGCLVGVGVTHSENVGARYDTVEGRLADLHNHTLTVDLGSGAQSFGWTPGDRHYRLRPENLRWRAEGGPAFRVPYSAICRDTNSVSVLPELAPDLATPTFEQRPLDAGRR
jgi:hypothetical protein